MRPQPGRGLEDVIVTRPQAAKSAELVLRKLKALAPLSAAECELVLSLSADRQLHEAGGDIFEEGEKPRPRVILSGWIGRVRRLADGRRQIFGFLLPGDPLRTLGESAPALASCVALTRAVTADAQPLMDWAAKEPNGALARALDKAATLDRSSLLAQIMRLGRQTAYERTANLLLELHARLTAVGLASGPRFPLPLTQDQLSDALGLSVVHVNRTLQQLRRDGLIETRHGQVDLLQPEKLAALADFTPM